MGLAQILINKAAKHIVTKVLINHIVEYCILIVFLNCLIRTNFFQYLIMPARVRVWWTPMSAASKTGPKFVKPPVRVSALRCSRLLGYQCVHTGTLLRGIGGVQQENEGSVIVNLWIDDVWSTGMQCIIWNSWNSWSFSISYQKLLRIQPIKALLYYV